MIDCHAHLYSVPDLPAELQAAADAGIAGILAVSESLDDARRILELSAAHPIVKPCAGLHPVNHGQSVRLEDLPPVLDFIREHADKLVCVGEIGLDYTRQVLSTEPEVAAARKDTQAAVFRQQLELARELGLPVNCHSRNAGHYVIDELRQAGVRDAVLHAFDGKASYAVQAATTLGYYFSVPPSCLRSDQMLAMVKALPLDRILLETDAPALGPVAREANVPSNLTFSVKAIAQAKACSEEEVRKATTENAKRLFRRLA